MKEGHGVQAHLADKLMTKLNKLTCVVTVISTALAIVWMCNSANSGTGNQMVNNYYDADKWITELGQGAQVRITESKREQIASQPVIDQIGATTKTLGYLNSDQEQLLLELVEGGLSVDSEVLNKAINAAAQKSGTRESYQNTLELLQKQIVVEKHRVVLSHVKRKEYWTVATGGDQPKLPAGYSCRSFEGAFSIGEQEVRVVVPYRAASEPVLLGLEDTERQLKRSIEALDIAKFNAMPQQDRQKVYEDSEQSRKRIRELLQTPVTEERSRALKEPVSYTHLTLPTILRV